MWPVDKYQVFSYEPVFSAAVRIRVNPCCYARFAPVISQHTHPGGIMAALGGGLPLALIEVV